MDKFWKVLTYEYKRHVLRKRFIFAILSVPFFVAVILAVSIIAAIAQTNTSPIGYVDQSGMLARPVTPRSSDDFFSRPVEIRAYPDEDSARAALNAKQIQAYYVLPQNYLQTGNGRLVSYKEPDNGTQRQFTEFLRANLLAGQPASVVNRISAGNNLVIQSADGSRQMSSEDWFNILIPIFAGILFLTVIFTSGGYLMGAVVEEKENRTMEIIITSVSPDQLMAAKILGNLSVGLTQMAIWVIFLSLAYVIGRSIFPWMERISIGGDFILLMVLALLPAFVMVAGLMATIGAMVTETREAQQLSGLFTLPIVIPYWFTYPIMTNPNGPLALGLSYFPLTAPVTLTLRAAFTQIPILQMGLNIGLLFLCAAGAVWLAARTFRLGMLSYGKRLTWRQVFARGI
ncbi:MAG TPA: ABC transporter permease [Anaerolineaceae bacterium]|nr:ABC transporter permease [Anaerolineaceae bacterium]